jgi:uncharacterized protein YabE (DUF348 family)
MKNKRLLVGAAILVCLAVLLAAVLHKTVTIDIDGQKSSVQTWSLTAGSVLASENIPLGPSDQLEPPQDTYLTNGQVIEIHRARSILVMADGKLIPLLTADAKPAAWLAQAGVTLNPGDVLLSGGKSVDAQSPTSENAVQVLRQHTLVVVHDGVSTTLKTTALTVGGALWAEGFRLRKTDIVTPSMEALVQPGMTIQLYPARLLHVTVAGKVYAMFSPANTVGAALADIGLAPQGLDYSLPAEGDSIPADGSIRLVRVQEDSVVHETPLPFKTTYAPVSDLEIDNLKVVQAGLSGIEATRERVRYEDGVEKSRQTDTTWVARPPQDKVIGYGTLVVKHTLKTPDGTIVYWRALQMYATSYHPAETGGDITASGLKLRKGLVGVDPRYIPYFTKMYVPGYGPALAADTGGGIFPRLIDLAYPDDEYVPWHQYVTVYFLWPPPDNIVYMYPQ